MVGKGLTLYLMELGLLFGAEQSHQGFLSRIMTAQANLNLEASRSSDVVSGGPTSGVETWMREMGDERD